ncbi:MAG: hypothetical protein PHX34_01750 [Candidatus Shapirobacteria bacterium]|nr:hypothetical protein [Candidatus Shapirobacteria bacterium]
MKQRLLNYLLPTTGLFIIISCFWVISGVRTTQLVYLFLGLFIGIFLLDIDHFIFWFLIKPNTEESRLIKLAIENKKFKSVIKIVQTSHQTHYNLIFHHYFFQVIFTLFSLFILTSTQNAFISALILSLNLHLVIDEIIGYKSNPKIVQKWLFAREPKQLPIVFLKRYIAIFITFIILFTFLLIQAKI